MDERGRAIERAALTTHDGAHRARALAERVRRGTLTYERVALGALLGDPTARALAGEPRGDPCALCRRPTLWGVCLGGEGGWPRRPLDVLTRAHQVSPVLVEATVRAAVAASVLSWRRGWAACGCLQCEGARNGGLTPDEVEGLNRSKREGGPVQPERPVYLWMCDSAMCAENASAAAACLVSTRPEMDTGRAARWDATMRAIGEHLRMVDDPLISPVYQEGNYREMEAMRGIQLGRRYADGAFDATGIDHDRLLRDRRRDGEERDAMMRVEFTGDGSEVVEVPVPVRRNATDLLLRHAPLTKRGLWPRGEGFVPRGPAWAYHLLAAVEALQFMRGEPRHLLRVPRDAMRGAVDALVLIEFERRATEPARFGPAAVFSDYPERATDGLRAALSWDEEAREVMDAVARWALAA